MIPHATSTSNTWKIGVLSRMARRLITNTRCPLCGEQVQEVPPAMLMKNPGTSDAELVITKTGLKQYIHSSCWYKMIEEKRPYNGKMYV